MKKIAFRELQANYTLSIDRIAPVLEPILLERDGEPLGMLVPLEEYDAYQQWRQELYEPLPQEPPRTPEGNLEALAAVERMATMFSNSKYGNVAATGRAISANSTTRTRSFYDVCLHFVRLVAGNSSPLRQLASIFR